MPQYLSDKLRLMSLIAIIMVLYIHSGFHPDEILGMKINGTVQTFLSGQIGRCAVPLFFIISGYLFFERVPNGMRSILEKMKKRARTLLVPYVVGCLFFVAFYALVALMPGTSRFMNSSIMPLFQQPLLQMAYAVFYDNGDGMPCAFQLWFLRDLIIIVALSPLCYVGLRRMGWGAVGLAFALSFIKCPHIPLYALFWFMLGGQLVGCEFIIHPTRRGWIGTGALALFLTLSVAQLFTPDAAYWYYFDTPTIMIGVIALWLMYDLLVSPYFLLSQHSFLFVASQYTFFIYLFHEPTLNVVRKLIVALGGQNQMSYLLAYLLSPWIFVLCAIPVGCLFRRYLPTCYKLCMGGR